MLFSSVVYFVIIKHFRFITIRGVTTVIVTTSEPGDDGTSFHNAREVTGLMLR